MKIKFKNKFLKMPRREFEAKRAMGQIPPADIKKWYKANGREDLQVKSESNHKGNRTMKIKFKSKKQALLEEEIQKHLEQVLLEEGFLDRLKGLFGKKKQEETPEEDLLGSDFKELEDNLIKELVAIHKNSIKSVFQAIADGKITYNIPPSGFYDSKKIEGFEDDFKKAVTATVALRAFRDNFLLDATGVREKVKTKIGSLIKKTNPELYGRLGDALGVATDRVLKATGKQLLQDTKTNFFRLSGAGSATKESGARAFDFISANEINSMVSPGGETKEERDAAEPTVKIGDQEVRDESGIVFYKGKGMLEALASNTSGDQNPYGVIGNLVSGAARKLGAKDILKRGVEVAQQELAQNIKQDPNLSQKGLDKEVEYHSSKKINESKMKIKFKSKKQALLEEEVQKHLEQVLSEVGSAKSRRKKIEDLEKKIKDLKAKLEDEPSNEELKDRKKDLEDEHDELVGKDLKSNLSGN